MAQFFWVFESNRRKKHLRVNAIIIFCTSLIFEANLQWNCSRKYCYVGMDRICWFDINDFAATKNGRRKIVALNCILFGLLLFIQIWNSSLANRKPKIFFPFKSLLACTDTWRILRGRVQRESHKNVGTFSRHWDISPSAFSRCFCFLHILFSIFLSSFSHLWILFSPQ